LGAVLRIDVTGDATVLAVDAELLKIVVQNLLLNGAHAMQGKGLIQVVVTSADGLAENTRTMVSSSHGSFVDFPRESFTLCYFSNQAIWLALALETLFLRVSGTIVGTALSDGIIEQFRRGSRRTRPVANDSGGIRADGRGNGVGNPARSIWP